MERIGSAVRIDQKTDRIDSTIGGMGHQYKRIVQQISGTNRLFAGRNDGGAKRRAQSGSNRLENGAHDERIRTWNNMGLA